MAVTEILASIEDINTHLPTDKLNADSDDWEADINLYEVDAARYVRAMLSGIFSAVTLSSWSSPDNTPDIIRTIAGRLIAAKFYATRIAEDSAEGSDYAQGLYNDAISAINAIRGGSMIVLDGEFNPVTTAGGDTLTEDDFWPNSSTGDPMFSVGRAFS